MNQTATITTKHGEFTLNFTSQIHFRAVSELVTERNKPYRVSAHFHLTGAQELPIGMHGGEWDVERDNYIKRPVCFSVIHKNIVHGKSYEEATSLTEESILAELISAIDVWALTPESQELLLAIAKEERTQAVKNAGIARNKALEAYEKAQSTLAEAVGAAFLAGNTVDLSTSGQG